MLENKISDSYRLLAKILFFCLGEVISLAKLVYEIGFLTENGTKNDVHMWDSFGHCIHVIQKSLCSTNLQVSNWLFLVRAPNISIFVGKLT
jgi:hypothetical protein